MKFNFCGVSGTVNENIKSNWEEVTTDYFQTKKEYEHDDEEMRHNYRYSLQVVDMESACGESGFEVIAYYVVSFDSLSEKHKQSIAESFDADFKKEDVNAYDLISEGFHCVQLGHEHVEDEDDLDGKIAEAMAFCESINGLRGFYLDKAWNMIGTNGWDVIRYSIGQQEDIFNYKN